jgi:glycine dehydrogenase subunit 1
MSLLGEEGLTRLARINHAKASALADRLGAIAGVEVVTSAFFNEFTVKLPKPAAPIVETLAAKGVIAGVPVSRLLPKDKNVENLLILAATETNTDDDFQALANALKEVL